MLPDATQVRIGGRVAGDGAPLFVIAEIGLNHDGSIERALALVDAAAAAGASAVKVQALFADELVAPGAPAPMHVEAASLADFFRRFELDERRLRPAGGAGPRTRPGRSSPRRSRERAVDMLDRVGVDAWKIASGDITFERLIERCGATGKPVIISTGMASLPGGAARALLGRRAPAPPAWRCCTACRRIRCRRAARTCAPSPRSAWPAAPSSASPITAPTASAVPLAVAMGAAIYERHLVLRADDDSIDAEPCRARPGELSALVRAAARAAAALGTGVKACLPAEKAESAIPAAARSTRGAGCRLDTSCRPPISSRCVPRSGSAPTAHATWWASGCAATSTAARRSRRPTCPCPTREPNMSLNVLITAGSRRVPLVRAFQRAVAQHRGGNVIVTDVNPLSPAVHAANRAYRVPLCPRPDYIDAVLDIALGERVSGWSCRPSTTSWCCSAARRRASANTGVRVAVSPAADLRAV